MKKRRAILEAAMQAVTVDRDATHGAMEDNFGRIAAIWSVRLGCTVTPAQVALMMIDLKTVRAWANPGHADNWIDIAGYSACGGEISAESVTSVAEPECRPVNMTVQTGSPDPAPAKPSPETPLKQKTPRRLESAVLKRPVPPKPAPAPAAEKSGPLTDAERDRIVEMTVAGRTVKEIAADLGRNTASVGRARGYLQERIDRATPPPEPKPAPAPERPPRVSLDIPKSARERAINVHLNGLGYSDRWTPCRDLGLVETICREGSKSLGSKPIGGITFTRDECLARWRLLNFQPGDLEHQAALLKVLRARAVAAADNPA